MSENMFLDVLEFHRKLKPGFIRQTPGWPDQEVLESYYGMIREEFKELGMAILKRDLPVTVDSIGDLLYVTFGMAVALGVDINPVWDLIQMANIAKEGGLTRDDGKILKPYGWISPDTAIAALIRHQNILDVIYPVSKYIQIEDGQK